MTTYEMSLFKGILDRGGMPVGLKTKFELLKKTKEEPSAEEEVTEMVEEEIPSEAEEPEIGVADEGNIEEPQPEPEPEPEPEPKEIVHYTEQSEPEPEDEPESEPEVMEEAIEETPPDEPEEPVVTEDQPEEPAPEPEPVKKSPNFLLSPESPVETDQAITIQGVIEGFEEIKGKEYWVQIVRIAESGGTEFIRNVPCTFEGERAVG